MSDMSLLESIERFTEGLKKASSRARELSKAQSNKHWEAIAILLDGLRDKGKRCYESKALSRHDVLKMVEERSKSIKV